MGEATPRKESEKDRYRIKKITDKFGYELFVAQAKFLGLWLDLSYQCLRFDVANDHIRRAVQQERCKRAKEVVEYLEPDL
jgi:hypothetical protein